jgi:chitinase
VRIDNNYCQVSSYPANWNFADWDNWAKNTSPNKNVKVYIGALASTSAGSTGYVDGATLANIAKTMQSQYSSFGGVVCDPKTCC